MTLDILYVIGSLNRGGTETHLLHVLPKLNKGEFRLKILLLSHEGMLADTFRKQGIELIQPWIKGGNLSTFSESLRLCLIGFQVFLYFLFKRPSVVHFFLPRNYLFAGPLAILCALPFRVMSRRSLNNYQKKYPFFIRKFEYWLHKHMDVILGNSQRVVDQLILEEGVNQERIQLLYNGLSIDQPPAKNIRADLDLAQDSLIFIIVANLIPYKGHSDLLEALGKANLGKNWDLLIVGNDSAHIQSDLQVQAQHLDISSHIHFLGTREDITELLNCADIGLLTSHEEGFSNAILEGMAAGLPMIVTDVGGNAESVIDGETGLVVPSRDPDKLTQALQKLSNDVDLRTRFGQTSKIRQQKYFSLEACIDAYEALYRKASK